MSWRSSWSQSLTSSCGQPSFLPVFLGQIGCWMPLFKYHSDQTTVSSSPPWLFHQRLDSGLTLPFMDLHLMNTLHVDGVMLPTWFISSHYLLIDLISWVKPLQSRAQRPPEPAVLQTTSCSASEPIKGKKTFLALSCFLGSHFQLTKLVIIKMSARGKRTERELDGKKKKIKNLILAGAQFACDRTHI